jgi:hypothetical protein
MTDPKLIMKLNRNGKGFTALLELHLNPYDDYVLSYALLLAFIDIIIKWCVRQM